MCFEYGIEWLCWMLIAYHTLCRAYASSIRCTENMQQVQIVCERARARAVRKHLPARCLSRPTNKTQCTILFVRRCIYGTRKREVRMLSTYMVIDWHMRMRMRSACAQSSCQHAFFVHIQKNAWHNRCGQECDNQESSRARKGIRTELLCFANPTNQLVIVYFVPEIDNSMEIVNKIDSYYEVEDTKKTKQTTYLANDLISFSNWSPSRILHQTIGTYIYISKRSEMCVV